MRMRYAAFLAAVLMGGSAFGQSSTYYITDGDSNQMWIVQGGALINVKPTFSLGYPLAVTSTIWLGDRDDRNAVQYDLAGDPTGSTSVGGNNFSQLLDGTTDAVMYNYGVECCGSTNSVTRANLDWTGQTVLFHLTNNAGANYDAGGITYDLTNATLYVSELNGLEIYHYDLAGNILGSFLSPSGAPMAGLAYEMATDTLWGYTNNFRGDERFIYQFTKNGSLLQSILVPNFGPFNAFGGEMMMIPEPASIALVGLGLAGLGLAARRARRSMDA